MVFAETHAQTDCLGRRRIGSTRDKFDIPSFYQQVPAILKSISVPTVVSVNVDGILRHGQSLRKLHIHQPEDSKGRWRADTITVDQLRALRDGCPSLEKLGIDLARHNEWPYEALDVLATFLWLRRLEISFELGLDDREHPLMPLVTFQAVAKLFKYLRMSTANTPSRLKKFEAHSGSPPIPRGGLLASTTFWPPSQSTSFVCMPAERDEEAAEGRIVIACPGMSARDDVVDAKVDEACQRIGDGPKKLRLALGGPIPVSEWTARLK